MYIVTHRYYVNNGFTVPGSPTQISSYPATSSSVVFRWNSPVQRNGVTTKYQLQCSGGGEVFSRTVTESTLSTTMSGLLPYIKYSCNITAHTSVGGGPAATTSVIALQDGEFVVK